MLNSEVRRLVRDLSMSADPQAVDAVAELLACFPVYRTYLPVNMSRLDDAAAEARRRRADLAATIDVIVPVLADPRHPAAIRFQQTSGMVMAKGVEDCAFYRFSRLGSLTEVGADPDEFAIEVDELHRRNERRQASWPMSMTTLTTHDTKRSEDTRARISALSEIPAQWLGGAARLHDLVPLGDEPLELLVWQAIVGTWPASPDRLHAYVEKAAREAGTSTSWTAPDATFEQRLHDLVGRAAADAEVRAIVEGLVEATTAAGWSNGLGAKLVQITSPGVPDVYQGTELWDTSLVDPDNRRPVDFDVRRALLARLDGGWLPPVDETGAAKLLVTSRALRLRRDRPELFAVYRPLDVVGAAAAHAIAFDRGGAVTVATRLSLGLDRAGGWRDTCIALAPGGWRDVITGTHHDGGVMRLADLLAIYPVALLTQS